MKRFTHIHGFTQSSGIAYWELDIEQLNVIHAIKLDGTRQDMTEHWNPEWTLDALAKGRWVEMMGEETPEQARARVKQQEFLEGWSPKRLVIQ